LATTARLIVGGVWIAAGALKVGDLTASGRSVVAYRILPYDASMSVGAILPFLELALGLLLVLGLATRIAAAASVVLFAVYIGGIASVWARGLQIDCGCFGGGGYRANATAAYPWEIARDTGLFLASCLLVWLRRTPWAVDNLLLGPIPSSSRTLSSKEA
jgi:uncharacterized membrane protein YphA (DoxX/SURF4 family)